MQGIFTKLHTTQLYFLAFYFMAFDYFFFFFEKSQHLLLAGLEPAIFMFCLEKIHECAQGASDSGLVLTSWLGIFLSASWLPPL